MAVDFEQYRAWIGRSEEVSDVITPLPATALAATLNIALQFGDGSNLPRLWHWLHFLHVSPQAQLGLDGHPMRGGFLPPIPLPRRMWAGGRLEFFSPLQIGDKVTRRSEILDVKHKQGKTGALVFVTVQHIIMRAAEVLIREEQDLVYREQSSNSVTPIAGPTTDRVGDHSQTVDPNPVFLFRYSALTLNGHRIHYDHPYATKVEGYPGLVVHGPLIATLLMQLLESSCPDLNLGSFSFKALSPLFDNGLFTISMQTQGDEIKLWATNPAGATAMDAVARIRV